MKLGLDPVEALDDLAVERLLTAGARAPRFEFDALGWWIYSLLADRPMGWIPLERELRRKRPRLLPDAVGRAVMALANRQLLEQDHRRRWHAKAIERIEFNLRRVA